jgi:hypothetical protein
MQRIDKVAEYRRKAYEAEAEAEKTKDAEAKRICREIAVKCRELAAFVDRRNTGST